ncbi:MAG: zinc carboxypeptidase, partial [Gemmatimonadetes bacterium]|nr:zinc carboxypeptidase [Gemmatimonadota bacterium]
MNGNPSKARRIGGRVTSAPILLPFLALMMLAISPSRVGAQNGYFFPEGERFDPQIPSPEEFLGYPIGTFTTRQDRIVAYLKELARLSDRATYQSIGTSFEHREMPVLTVTSPENHGRLEAIRQEHLASLEPGGATAGDLPAIAHFGYNVHGNEASGGEAALLTAYWLVAGMGAEIDRYLDEGIFHIEPTLNPDGRDRYASWTSVNRAQPFVPDPVDREHNEVWPGGRTNHYWFDLNRDWFPLVNPESRARIEFHHHWRPNLVTDHHEMGTSSTFFFEPTKPVGTWNPLLPERLYTDLTVTFADYWTEVMDDIGSMFFSEEVYDNSYPGYGSTYPNFLGGLAVLFEQASSRGFVQESPHHGLLTFAFTIRNQLRAAMASARATVENRESLHEYQREFYASALSEGDQYEVSGWVFGDPRDATLNREFIDLLLRHRIELYEIDSPREGGGVSFRPGTAWVVPASQPMYRLARSVFERVESFADSVFYDASAWTVSLAFGMPDLALTGGDLPLGSRVTEVPAPEGAEAVVRSSIAYLFDWRDSGAPKTLQALQASGVRAEAAFKGFTARTVGGDVGFSPGSISVPVTIQTITPDSLHSAVN